MFTSLALALCGSLVPWSPRVPSGWPVWGFPAQEHWYLGAGDVSPGHLAASGGSLKPTTWPTSSTPSCIWACQCWLARRSLWRSLWFSFVTSLSPYYEDTSEFRWFFFTFLASLTFFSNHESTAPGILYETCPVTAFPLCRYETSIGASLWKAWSHLTKEIIPAWWRTITGPSITRTTSTLWVSLPLPECQPCAILLQLDSFEVVKVSLLPPCAFRRVGLFSFFLNTGCHLRRMLLSFDSVLFLTSWVTCVYHGPLGSQASSCVMWMWCEMCWCFGSWDFSEKSISVCREWVQLGRGGTLFLKEGQLYNNAGWRVKENMF